MTNQADIFQQTGSILVTDEDLPKIKLNHPKNTIDWYYIFLIIIYWMAISSALTSIIYALKG